MMRVRIVLVLCALCAACTSSHTAIRSGNSGDVLTRAARPNPSNHLTGFGATSANWRRHHTMDQDPQLERGCCYLPKIRSNTGSSLQDTWFALYDDGGTVSMYERAFPKGTSEKEATSMIAADDLPRDAKLVKSKVGAGCKLFLYRSRMLAHAEPDLGQWISVYFESLPDPDNYDPSNVSDGGLAPGSGGSLGRC